MLGGGGAGIRKGRKVFEMALCVSSPPIDFLFVRPYKKDLNPDMVQRPAVSEKYQPARKTHAAPDCESIYIMMAEKDKTGMSMSEIINWL